MHEQDPSNETGLQQFHAFCEERARLARTENPQRASKAPCPLCGGEGYSREMVNDYELIKKCRCQRKWDLEKALENAGIPLKFRQVTLEEHPVDGRLVFKPYGGLRGRNDPVAIKSQTEALKVCRQLRDLYVDVFLHGKKVDDLYGLLLYGECGRGKTRLACSLLVDLIYMGIRDVRFIEYNELFKLIRFSFDSEELSYQQIFEELIGARILVIDDFATEVSNNLVWVIDNIGYVINERYVANRPTILTCNYWHSIKGENDPSQARDRPNPYETHKSWELRGAHKQEKAEEARQKFHEEIKARIDHRLRSRILEMCYEFKIEGYDYRKRIEYNRDKLSQKRAMDEKNKQNGGAPPSLPGGPSRDGADP